MIEEQNQLTKKVTYEAGQVIFAEGEPSLHLCIIKYGEIGIFKEKNGMVILVSVISSKDFIGELSIFDEGTRSASAVALSQSEVHLINKSSIQEVLKSCPDWVSNIMTTISDRLRSTTTLLREHRIADDIHETGINLTTEKLSSYWKSIKEYKALQQI